MIINSKTFDHKKYVAWVDSNPDITGYDTYLEAYQAMMGNGTQRSLNEYGDEQK